jgi:hypothetical protein
MSKESCVITGVIRPLLLPMAREDEAARKVLIL